MTANSESDTTAALTPLSIEIGGPGSKAFKSIDELVWDAIPPFAVLTGVNGSGKTQLLELLAYKLTNTVHPQYGELRDITVKVTGDSFGPDSVAFIPNSQTMSGSPTIGLEQMRQIKTQLYQQLRPQHIAGNLTFKSETIAVGTLPAHRSPGRFTFRGIHQKNP
jgi:hypothetical protein